ncbi:MAG TPA: Crp/Fnr family transcriptional regulator, partial [Blastocatellia bacterium]|nr:Crp/Fnr family transcriptional regulator [Blastocatellia bacterium]
GALLFVEGQLPRGVFVICAGRVKLSTCSKDGKALITRLAEPGEILGLSAAILGIPYESTAETLDPCQINFIRREDFLRLISDHSAACLKAAEHLSSHYHHAHEQARSLGLAHSAAAKLAKLILEWGTHQGTETDRGIRIKLTLTHEEIAQVIGTSRETVTRLFGEFKSRQILYLKGSTLIIHNRAALEAMAGS